MGALIARVHVRIPSHFDSGDAYGLLYEELLCSENKCAGTTCLMTLKQQALQVRMISLVSCSATTRHLPLPFHDRSTCI